MDEEGFPNEPYLVERLAESDLFWAIVERDGWNERACIAAFAYEDDARKAVDILKQEERDVELLDVVEKHIYYQDRS